MFTRFPQAVPEVPVSDIQTSSGYYIHSLGFHLDWHSEPDGIAGISQGDCRLFLATAAFRHPHGNNPPLVLWLNLESKQEVDELHSAWRNAGARILSAPEDKPWRLREFTATDPDGNRLRVFYDFTHDAPHTAGAP